MPRRRGILIAFAALAVRWDATSASDADPRRLRLLRTFATTPLLSRRGGGGGGGRSSPSAFAAGGFGGGGGFGAPKKSSSPKKTRRGKRRGALADLPGPPKPATMGTATATATPAKEEGGPKLDRFGLPVATEDNIFPPLPADEELIPVSEGYVTKLSDVRAAMEKHIELDYELFDEDGVELAQDGRVPMRLRLLHRSPPVLGIDNFFTPEECEEYISISSPAPQRGGGGGRDETMEVRSATFSTLASSTRTSTTWFCRYSRVPTLLAKARRLLKKLDLERMEEPQLVRYRTGERFSWHYDELPPGPLLQNGGQRVATLLVYLRTIDEGRGGSTVFRDLSSPDGSQLSVRPVRGSALLFFPALADGTPDERTLHKGDMAVDEKMIGQIWVHERSYEPAVPEGNSHDKAMREAVEAKERELGYA